MQVRDGECFGCRADCLFLMKLNFISDCKVLTQQYIIYVHEIGVTSDYKIFGYSKLIIRARPKQW